VISDDYSCRQSARDTEYESADREWTNSMPARQRRRLKADGLDSPVVDRHASGSSHGDAADSPHMREGSDPALQPHGTLPSAKDAQGVAGVAQVTLRMGLVPGEKALQQGTRRCAQKRPPFRSKGRLSPAGQWNFPCP